MSLIHHFQVSNKRKKQIKIEKKRKKKPKPKFATHKNEMKTTNDSNAE